MFGFGCEVESAGASLVGQGNGGRSCRSGWSAKDAVVNLIANGMAPVKAFPGWSW